MKQRKSLWVLFACLTLVIPATEARGQLIEKWVAEFDGPTQGPDDARDIVVDDSGYVYVTGSSVGFGTLKDYATIKYSPARDTIWVRRYNGPSNADDEASALTLDATGNVYVTGYSQGASSAKDYATLKYSPSGELLWEARYDGPASADDNATSIIVNSNGQVCVTGHSDGTGAGEVGFDCATIMYAPSGDTVWTRRYDGPGNSRDYGRAIGMDDSGHVYVAGESAAADLGADYVTIKYDATGDLVWLQRYDGPHGSHDAAFAMAVDGPGNAYVTGYINDTLTGWSYVTLKYTANGDTAWVRRYGDGANAIPRAITVDHNGNVIVTGSTNPLSSEADYATVKYSPDGDSLWTKLFDGPAGSKDIAFDLAVDSGNNIYITGASALGSYQDHYGDVHYIEGFATLRYTPNGDPVGLGLYLNGRYDAYSAFPLRRIAVSDSGIVYVTGTIRANSGDYATIKHTWRPGDVNCDGIRDLADVVLVGNHVDGITVETNPCSVLAGDMNEDSVITGDDYDLLFDEVAGVAP